MTEYDYSPEAYERFLANQSRVSNWVFDANQHAKEFVDPLREPPHRFRSPFYNSDDDSGELPRPRVLERAFTAPHPHHRHQQQQQQQHYYGGRRPSRPPTPSASSSSSTTSSSSSTSSMTRHTPINPYKYDPPSHKHSPHPPFDARPGVGRAHTHMPFRTAAGTDMLLPVGKNVVVIDGNRVELVVRAPPAFLR
jgi:hypothetical protein